MISLGIVWETDFALCIDNPVPRQGVMVGKLAELVPNPAGPAGQACLAGELAVAA